MGKSIVEETWNLDHSLCKWLGKRLQVLSENTCSYPAKFDTLEDWQEALTKRAKILTDYANVDTFLDEGFEEKAEAAQKAIRWVANNLTKLWS